MIKEILELENLIEVHDALNDFAKHHNNKGGQDAHKLIKAIWDATRRCPRDGSPEGLLRGQGYDEAMKEVLNALHHKFVP